MHSQDIRTNNHDKVCAVCAAPKNCLVDTGYKKAEFCMLHCENCLNDFLNPMPTDSELHTYYQNSYAERTEEYVDRNESTLTPLYFSLIKKFSPAAKTVCEVGCSEGNVLYGLKNRGLEVTGYDLSEHSAELGRKILDVNIVPRALTEETDGKFDVLISSHVAEHLNRPRDDMRVYAANLKPGGTLIITVPNGKSLNVRIFRNFHIWFAIPDHLFYFNKENMKKNMEAAGFEVKKIFTRNDKFSLFFMFMLSFVNYFLEKRSPAKPYAWRAALTKTDKRSLRKRNVKRAIFKIAESVLFVFSKPAEFVAGFFDINDELWIIAEKPLTTDKQ